MASDREQIVEVIEAGPVGAAWQPVVGDVTARLRERFVRTGMPTTAAKRVITEASHVLSQCTPPTAVCVPCSGGGSRGGRDSRRAEMHDRRLHAPGVLPTSLSGTVAALPAIPTEEDITAAVAKLVELFRALEAPPRTSLQGLWCELLLIGRASNIRQAAAAWHADPNALHDFVAWRQRVEVKSTTGPHRARASSAPGFMEGGVPVSQEQNRSSRCARH